MKRMGKEHGRIAGKQRDFGRLRYGSVSLLILVLLIGALIVLNIGIYAMEKKGGWRADWSFNSLTTHSEATTKILEKLERKVQIYALYRRGAEDLPLMELLNRYAAATPMVTWEQVDPGLNPGLIARFSTETDPVTSESLIVSCEETGRWQVLTARDFVSLGLEAETGNYTSAGWTYERSITQAIQYVTREKIPQVVIAQGHGELNESAAAALTELLEANQYEVRFSALSGSGDLPEAEDLLVFLSPLRDLTEDEFETMKRFADEGGSFLFTCDYSDPIAGMTNYAALLRSYGIVPMEGIVCADTEDSGGYYQGSRVQLIPEMCSTDLTIDLLAAGMNTVLLPGCRAFETPEEGDRNLIAAEVLRSGKGSYLKRVDTQTTNMDRMDGDPGGPFSLAIQARRVTEGGRVSRAFAIGCSALMTESQIWAMTDSQQLILRVMAFLVDLNPDKLNITERDALRPALSVGSVGAGSVLLVLLPTAVVFVALAVLLPRRKR